MLLKRYFRNVYQRKIVPASKAFGNVLLRYKAHKKFVVKQKKLANFVVESDFSLKFLLEKYSLLPGLKLPKLQIVRSFDVGEFYKIEILQDQETGFDYFALINSTTGLTFDLILLDNQSFEFFQKVDFMEL